jgi:gliding motility-associated-like protein
MGQVGNGTPGVNNLGEVITGQKNFALDAEVTEQVTAMYHQNCEDIWIVAHRGNSGFSSDEYIAFLVTASGVQTAPVVSAVGMSNSGGNRFGYLRASNDGKRICSALGTGGSSFQGATVEVLDFDNSTGVVSNPIVIADGGSINSAYSAEFSPDDNLLYVVSYNGTHIYQFDLSSGVQSTIQASKTDIATGNAVKPCLQIGPDKKIYVALRNSTYLGVIDQPNSIGQACSFSSTAVVLSSSNSGLGLPTFLKPLYEQTNHLAVGCHCGLVHSFCYGDSVLLAASFYQPSSNISYLWHDSLTSHDHMVSQTGTYWVSGFDGNCFYQDTFEVLLHDLPEPDAGEDTCICLGDNVIIGSTPVANWDYLWQPTGVDSSTCLAEPIDEQTYILNVVDTITGCQGLDSIVVCVNPLPNIQALSDTTIMEGGEASLNASGGVDYLWSSDLIIDCPDCPQIQVSMDSATYFYLSGLDSNGCSGLDTVLVNVLYNDTLFVPNLFSPNMDGNNDVLYVRTFGRFENVHFRLFNRWGKLVFETMDETIGWDGYYDGTLQPVDAYIYHLTASTLDGQTFIQKGDITLLR